MDLLIHTQNAVPEWAQTSILMGLRGSDAHGTKLSNDDPNAVDDTDVFSVVVQPVDFYLSLDGYNQKSLKLREVWDSAGDDVDILVYDVRKFMWLLLGSNPNVVSWLWNRPEDYLYVSPMGQILIDNRQEFVTKKLLSALHGYATEQRDRMLRRNKYQGYMGEKRKALVDQYGYDVKFAAHALRLVLLGIEAATEHTVNSYRPKWERELLCEIKAGKAGFDNVINLLHVQLAEFLYRKEICTLPEEVNKTKVDALLLQILRNQ